MPISNILEGDGGIVLSALALHAVLPEHRVAGVARAAGERLLTAEATEPGFGYGASGVAVALARLYEIFPEPGYASRARTLITGEKSPGAETGWCQGAAGSALARLELRTCSAFASPEAAHELERSLEDHLNLVRDGPVPDDDSLCHGTFSHLELLQATSPHHNRTPWRTALPAPAPGLFAGLSGIGFGLLRRACPADVPSVLTLAPPIP